MKRAVIDCVVIGYNEPPFEQYVELVARYGRESEAYRDLRFSFVELNGRRLDYVSLLSHAYEQAHPDRGPFDPVDRIKSGDIPNLAAAYLTNALRRRFTAEFINLFHLEKEQLATLLREGARTVAITTTFYVLNLPVIEIVRFVREQNAEAKIVVGGPLVGNHVRRCTPEELELVFEEIGADVYVLDAQGEATLSRVVEALKEGLPLASVPNIVYQDGARLRRTSTVPENNALDDHWIDWRTLADHPLGATLQSRTARSCAFSCAFCAYPTRAGRLTLANVDTVERELESMRAVGGVRNVVFIDDTFNVPLPRFKRLCRRLIERGFGFDWYSYFRCSNVDEEAVALAAASGCRGVFLGIESASNEVLMHMNKGATIDHYRRGIDLLRRYGILTFGSFIAGHPGETEETFKETVSFIKETSLDYYRIQLWYCEPGTPIVDQGARWDIRGHGFRWQHRTMSSKVAMQLIENAFLEIEEPIWLPQWSFDFWIIPYLRGRELTDTAFRKAMSAARDLLALAIRGDGELVRSRVEARALAELTSAMRDVRLERREADQ